MKHTVEDRADRLARRRNGWYDRRTYYWASTRLSIALRDTERALFSRIGPNVKPDWSGAFRPLVWIGVAWYVIVGAVLALHWLGVIR